MNRLQANICLFSATIMCSLSYVVIAVIPDGVSTFAITFVTYAIAAVLTGACFFTRVFAAVKQDGLRLVKRVAFLSVLSTVLNLIWIVALDYFDAAVGALLSSVVVIVMPPLLLLMRRHVGARTWIAAGLVLLGCAVVVAPVFSGEIVVGLVLMTLVCIIRGVYIIKIGDYVGEHDPVALAVGVIVMNTLFSFVPWCIAEPALFAGIPWNQTVIAAFLIIGFFIVAFATVFCTFGQIRAEPAQATIIYATEVVFSTVWATCLPATLIEPVVVTVPLMVALVCILLGNLVEIVHLPGEADAEAEAETAAEPVHSYAPRDTTPTFERFMAAPGPFPGRGARMVALFVVLLAIYCAISLPFKVLSIIPGFTDVRPVGMLMPVYGIYFGPVGCLAYAVGNLIGDIASESLRWSSIAGFVANFVYPYLMYVIFVKLRRTGFELRNWRSVLLACAAMVALAALQAAIITPAVALIYPEIDAALFALTVVLNSSLFPILVSIPFMMLAQEELGLVPLRASGAE